MTKTEKILVIKNKHLMSLASWLNEQPLHGPQSRERSRFVKILAERIGENEKFRQEILEKNMKETTNEETKEVTKELDHETANKEYGELMEEEFRLQITGVNREQFDHIKKIVLDTRYTFGPKEGQTPEEKQYEIRKANDYLAWCDAFEAV